MYGVLGANRHIKELRNESAILEVFACSIYMDGAG
jgi:hypothetical protein